MKRMFWLGLGVAAGVYGTRRVTAATQRLRPSALLRPSVPRSSVLRPSVPRPSGLGADVADGLRQLGAGLGAFGAEVRAGMRERERELTDLVERRTGASLPTVTDALTEAPAPGTRARRAGA